MTNEQSPDTRRRVVKPVSNGQPEPGVEDTNPDTEATDMVEVIVVRGIGGPDGNMIWPSDKPVSIPKAMAKKLQKAGAVQIYLGDD